MHSVVIRSLIINIHVKEQKICLSLGDTIITRFSVMGVRARRLEPLSPYVIAFTNPKD